ncbi:hypothetical protein [Bacillus safensis]|uniref:hypothetical protein n=1 Tax=Bacillus safensis TaxID=561879 RepID=UPI0022AB5C05|nr:hypothetical protein [Bacillus safensis]WAT81796.1 hypothetical protein O0R49_05420 [Bacillus safensis]
MTEKKEIQGKISGQFQTNDKNYLILEVTSEDKARGDINFNINIGNVVKISLI